MYTRIQKWGNSRAVRIPKGIMEAAGLYEDDRVEIKAVKGTIVIGRAGKKHIKLEERLAGYTGDYRCDEWDTGKAKGKEVW
ncbi:MAG: AbrB/MazE/SpoVT family DNA-binding domain-containing protein [Bacillota bacterium]|nr:AbrB/MazE/SpoVT family DNA-binding domain-containing protein [Bacillota bacterium]MDD3298951.1 AbrB/MazE/SpoVT family DNA-binding domain-containing protein [Bacillota bacterium]MDD3851708.1 AbrB/MazE/SpoVT family DNA-binding domain-containing protein [Bacillota bacterium]MDD4708068.1 AbrB/MazE/SpoVT family DNA-binding domain-containing protein [Bacillota bacterium]